MVLVDTSVWVSHLRDGNPVLASLLDNGEVLCHPLIIGELACGSLKIRSTILSFLQLLQMGLEAEHEEILSFIGDKHLMGKGIGYIDIHLLASSMLSDVPLWTYDNSLALAADSLHIKYLV